LTWDSKDLYGKVEATREIVVASPERADAAGR
jgi:hypothetical protein